MFAKFLLLFTYCLSLLLLFMGVCVRFLFCYAVLCVFSIFAIISLGKRKLVGIHFLVSCVCYCTLRLLHGTMG